MEFDSFLGAVAASTIAATLVLIIVRLRARSPRRTEKRNSRPKKKEKLNRVQHCIPAVAARRISITFRRCPPNVRAKLGLK